MAENRDGSGIPILDSSTAAPPWREPAVSRRPDVDLAALTEAVHARLAAAVGGAVVSWSMDEDGEPTERDDFVSGSLTAVVRAVLEALPREWGAEIRPRDGAWVSVGTWYESRVVAAQVATNWLAAGASESRVVQRAVGPPIPAEDARRLDYQSDYPPEPDPMGENWSHGPPIPAEDA